MLLKRAEPKPKIPTQSDYNAMAIERRREIDKLCRRLQKGDIDVREWGEAFHGILAKGHTEAWFLGRTLAGDLSPLSAIDRQLGTQKAELQGEFVQRFMATLNDEALPAGKGGLYDGEGDLDLGKVLSRADLYIGNMRATAAEGFVTGGDDDDLYDWVLGDTEKHCDECPMWADLGPYAMHSLPLYPGDGTTPCLGNCACTLVRQSDGRASFGAN